MRYLVILLVVLLPASVWATYNDSTVSQVDPVTPQGTVSITATFTGPGEPAVKQNVVLPWNYSDDALDEWSASVIERLNGVKGLPTRIKSGDKLSITRPVKPVSPIP